MLRKETFPDKKLMADLHQLNPELRLVFIFMENSPLSHWRRTIKKKKLPRCRKDSLWMPKVFLKRPATESALLSTPVQQLLIRLKSLVKRLEDHLNFQ